MDKTLNSYSLSSSFSRDVVRQILLKFVHVSRNFFQTRRLATANRPRMIICVTEIWREIFPSSSLIAMQNLVVECHTERALVGGPKKIWALEPNFWTVRLLKHARHSSSERSERFVRFEPNVRSERVRYFSERETNVQALKRLINLIAVK